MLKINRAKGLPAIYGSALLGLIPGIVADAANPESVTLDMTFLDPVTITEITPLRFGLLNVNMRNNERVIVAPDSSVTDTKNNILGGTQGAANLTVTATASQAITILVDNVSTATGYVLESWTCNYDAAGADSNCDGAGYTETSVASATLLIGATLKGNGSAVAGTDNSTFDVTVNYQ